MAAFHPRVPGLHDRGDLVIPLRDDDRASRDDRDDRARVRCGDGVDERDLVIAEPQRRAVAAAREPALVAPRPDVLRCGHRSSGLALGLEAGDQGRVVGRGHEAAEVGARVADVLALVRVGVPDHDEGDVGIAGDLCGGVDVSAVVVHDVGVRQRRREAVEHGDDLGRPDVARPAVAEVHDRREPAEHGDPLSSDP